MNVRYQEVLVAVVVVVGEVRASTLSLIVLAQARGLAGVLESQVAQVAVKLVAMTVDEIDVE